MYLQVVCECRRIINLTWHELAFIATEYQHHTVNIPRNAPFSASFWNRSGRSIFRIHVKTINYTSEVMRGFKPRNNVTTEPPSSHWLSGLQAERRRARGTPGRRASVPVSCRSIVCAALLRPAGLFSFITEADRLGAYLAAHSPVKWTRLPL